MTVVYGERYERLGATPLGKGHFGEVWLARDLIQGQEVALKILLPGVLPAQVRRMLAYQEARFLTELRGPRILPVEDAGTDRTRDVAFLATGVALAGSAADAVKREPFGLFPYVAVDWTGQMLVGLESCHAAGVLHGDVKPGNILLERDDSALLGDFGVAQRMDPAGRAPPAGDLLVTPREALTMNYIDIRSDVYAAGVALFNLLSGRWPYSAASESELRQAIVAAQPTSLRDIAPHVPLPVIRIVEKAISPDPSQRFESAQAMRLELSRLAAFSRTWRRVSPHPAHAACWEEWRPGGAAHRVCVTDLGGRFTIRVTRGAGGVRHDLTKPDLRGRQLPAALRVTFREIGQ